MPSKTMEILVLEADPEPNKGGYYRYRCRWTAASGEAKEEWLSSKTRGLRIDTRYSCNMTCTEHTRNGKTYWNITVSDAEPVGGPPPVAARSSPDVPTVRALKEAALAAEIANAVAVEMPDRDPATVNTVLIHLFGRGILDRFIAENAEAEEGEPEEFIADGTPPSEIPF